MITTGLTDKEWFSLPLSLRQRWWKETSYGSIEPSTELKLEIEKYKSVAT